MCNRAPRPHPPTHTPYPPPAPPPAARSVRRDWTYTPSDRIAPCPSQGAGNRPPYPPLREFRDTLVADLNQVAGPLIVVGAELRSRYCPGYTRVFALLV